MNMTKQEMNLINVVRSLCFEDILDAVTGIQIEQGNAIAMIHKKENEGDKLNAQGFRERAQNLDRLQDALEQANADYRSHVNPEEVFKESVTTEVRMKDLVGEIRSEGKVISFKEFLGDIGGSGELYDSWYSDILKAALNPDTDWVEVDDILGPLAHEILSEAFQVNMEVYLELAAAVKLAYEKLLEKQREVENADREYIINENTVDVFTVIEDMLHHFNKGWIIKEFKAIDAGDCHLVLKHPESTEDPQ
jgi:hypothetical protein